MTQRVLGIGTAVIAVVLTAGVAVAQRADEPQDQTGQVVQQVPPPQTPPPGQAQQQGPGQPGVPGQVGPGRGMRGMGMGMGLGPGQGRGPGQGMGPGFGRGQGVGRGMGGPGRGMGPGRGQGGPGAGQGVGAGRGGMLARLDLTQDQQGAVQTIERATRDQAAGITDELDLARKALHRELFADKRDPAKVTALATKVTTLEKQLFDLHLKTQASIADLLTPTQRETMRIGR